MVMLVTMIMFIAYALNARHPGGVNRLRSVHKIIIDEYGKTVRGIQKSRKTKKLQQDWRALKAMGSLTLYHRIVIWETLKNHPGVDLVQVGDDLEKYVDNELQDKRSPVVVVVMDDFYQSSDASAFDYRNFTSSPFVRHVFAEDWVSSINSGNVTLLPIGIASRAIHDEEQLLTVARALPPPSERLPLSILCTAHLGRYLHPQSGLGDDRSEMFNALSNFNLVHFLPERTTKLELWRLHKNFAFELCPEGNGVDTFRFYEAVALRTVPIVKRNSLQPLYSQFGAVIVDNWSDAVTLLQNETFIAQVLDSFERNYDDIFSRLSSDYWLNAIFKAVNHDYR